MADRVHPAAAMDQDLSTPPPAVVKPISPQGTYVIQIPKDQVYRVPPPENSLKIQKFANRKPRRSCCCRCFCWTIATAFIILIILTIASAVLYFVFRPEKLKYSIDSISVQGINATSSAPVSPRITVKIREGNPNGKVSVYYNGNGSSVSAYYDDVKLCNGDLPTFEQPANNVTVIQTTLKGSDVILARDVHSRLVTQQRERNVPLMLKVKASVKVKIGAVKTWAITVTIKCDVVVDQLTEKSKILSKNCSHRVKPW